MDKTVSIKNLDQLATFPNLQTIPRFRVFEKAKKSALTLLSLKRFLTSSELETLEILLDKNSLTQLSQSLKEAKEGKLTPLENILK